jgi:hypothetical protein
VQAYPGEPNFSPWTISPARFPNLTITMSRAYFHMVGSGLKGLGEDLKGVYRETVESIENGTDNEAKMPVSCSQ